MALWSECILFKGTLLCQATSFRSHLFLGLVYLHCHLVVFQPSHSWDLLVPLSQKRLLSPGLLFPLGEGGI